MIAVDSNLLVYAHRWEATEDYEAFALIRSLVDGDEAWAIPWPCIYEFFGVVTNRRIWRDGATTPEQAWLQISAWAASPSLRLLGETDGFLEILGQFAQRPRVRGGVIHDARIAAICMAHGVDTLLTRDRDFALFPELPTRDPFLNS